jgi:trans-aconitate methyltransferase
MAQISANELAPAIVSEQCEAEKAGKSFAESLGILIDIGCGPGYLAEKIARRFPALHVIGLDIAPEMVVMASRRLAASNLAPRLEFRQGDI